MFVGIIGFGIVGKAVSNTFSKKFDIIKYDKFLKLDNFKELNQCAFVFINVPTPFDCSKNITDDTAVVESLKRLESISFSGCVIIKSTLPPGKCDEYELKYDLKFCFNPEFLRESTTPNEDFKNQKEIVIGSYNFEIFEKVKYMYKLVCLENANYYNTTPIEAEMIKYSQNTMLASRVAIANLIFDACSERQIDYNMIRSIAFDKFEIIGPYMTQVPGPDGERGFGGKCLPKDIRGFSTITKSSLLEEIISYNDSLRKDLDKVLNNFQRDST